MFPRLGGTLQPKTRLTRLIHKFKCIKKRNLVEKHKLIKKTMVSLLIIGLSKIKRLMRKVLKLSLRHLSNKNHKQIPWYNKSLNRFTHLLSMKHINKGNCVNTKSS